MTISTRAAIFITLYDLKIQFFSWDYVFLYDETKSEEEYPNVPRYKLLISIKQNKLYKQYSTIFNCI